MGKSIGGQKPVKPKLKPATVIPSSRKIPKPGKNKRNGG